MVYAASCKIGIKQVFAVVTFKQDIVETGETILEKVCISGKQHRAAFLVTDKKPERLSRIMLNRERQHLKAAYPNRFERWHGAEER